MQSASISDASAWYWQRVAASAAVPDASLGIFRWVFGLYLLILQAPHFSWIDDVPHGFFDPPYLSPAYPVGGFLPSPVFTVVDVLALVALVAMTIGWNTRIATASLLVLRLLGSAFAYSFGKIDHNIIIDALLLSMLVADWGRHHSLDARHRDDAGSSCSRSTQRGVALFATILAFGLLTAGVPKLMHWVDGDLSTSGILSWYYENRFSLGRDRFLADMVPGTPAILLELGDYVAALLEISAFAFLLIGRRAWRRYLLVITAFHLMNALVLNIAFTTQALTYLVFVDLRPFTALVRKRGVQLAAVAVAVVAGAAQIGARLAGAASPAIGIDGFADYLDLMLSAAVPICVVCILLLAVDSLRTQHPDGHPGSAVAFDDRIAPVTHPTTTLP